jgi:acyl-CoA dehydrogenase
MDFTPSEKAQQIARKLDRFMREQVEPVEPEWHRQMAELDDPRRG